MTVEQLVKAGMALIGAALGNYVRKNAGPFTLQLRTTYKLSGRVDKAERNAAIDASIMDALLHISYDPIFKVDLKGNLFYANPAWAGYTGYQNVADAYGKNFMVLIPQGRETERIEKISEWIEERPAAWEGEVNMNHLITKEPLFSRCRTQLVTDELNVPVFMLGRLQVLKPNTP